MLKRKRRIEVARYLSCLALLALLAVFAPVAPVGAQTCPPDHGGYARAVMRMSPFDDFYNRADETLEIADPWMNPCQGVAYHERWVSEVLRLVDIPNSTQVAIGWYRKCTLTGPIDRFFYYAGGASPREFRDSFGNPVSSTPGDRWDLTMERQSFGPDPATREWRFQIDGPGGTFEAAAGMASGFQPNQLEAGGEALKDLNDLGVSGHLEPTARLANPGSGQKAFMIMSSDVVTVHETLPSRYMIDRAASGGFGGKGWLQTTSDIHRSVSPTAVPTNMVNCSSP